MGALASTVFLLLAAAPNVSLTLPASLTCPSAASLSERLGRVGLPMVAFGAALDVAITVEPDGLLLTARRNADGKRFSRKLKSGDDCNTLERLVTVLVHSWARLRLPSLAPGARPPRTDADLDGGASR